MPVSARASSARWTLRWLDPSASASAELDHVSPSAMRASTVACFSSTGRASTTIPAARRGTIALSHQIIDLALHGPASYPRTEGPDSLWNLIGQLFNDGESTRVP